LSSFFFACSDEMKDLSLVEALQRRLGLPAMEKRLPGKHQEALPV